MKDKLFFWIDGDFTSYCIAYYLQQRLDYDAFAIIDVTNKPRKFFQKQEFVKFKRTWYYHDHFQNMKKPDLDYLSSFEKKYDIDLWKLAINERMFYRYNRIYKFNKNEILSILEQECKLFEKIFNEIKPDFYISHTPFFHNHELLYRLFRKQGVNTLLLSIPHISKCIISQEPKKLDSVKNLEGINGTNRDFPELLQYLKSFNRFDREKVTRQQFKTSTTEQIKAATDFLFSSNNSNIKTHYSYSGRTKLRVHLQRLHALY